MVDSIRVLHVDDDPDFSELTAHSLEKENNRLHVETGDNAEQGMNALANEEFDCVVSDYNMPGDNGIEFLRAVRNQYPDLPFILYTSKESEAVAMEAISAGVTDYLQKEGGTHNFSVLANRITNAVESHRSTQQLADQNRELRWYKQMVNSMKEAACVYDKAGRFMIVNEYLANWYNTTQGDLIGQQSNLIPLIRAQADGGDPYQDLLDGAREQVAGIMNVGFFGPGNAVIEYRLTPFVIDGSIEGAVGVARDITHEKAREQKLRLERDRLEEFADVVSHDLQNPLQVIEGRLELAQQECDSEHLDPIASAVDRMGNIIEDILALSREGKDIGTLDEVVVGEVVDTAWEIATDQEADIALEYADDEVRDRTIKADAERLRHLFENLFSNAIDHGGRDTTVTIGTLNEGIYVEDDGSGIPESERADVVAAGYSTNTDGTGFGLSIVNRIADAHGWDLHVTESHTGGARFEITSVEVAAE